MEDFCAKIAEDIEVITSGIIYLVIAAVGFALCGLIISIGLLRR